MLFYLRHIDRWWDRPILTLINLLIAILWCWNFLAHLECVLTYIFPEVVSLLDAKFILRHQQINTADIVFLGTQWRINWTSTWKLVNIKVLIRAWSYLMIFQGPFNRRCFSSFLEFLLFINLIFIFSKFN